MIHLRVLTLYVYAPLGGASCSLLDQSRMSVIKPVHSIEENLPCTQDHAHARPTPEASEVVRHRTVQSCSPSYLQ